MPETMIARIKLLLAIPHLGGGGAERVTALLARHLNPDRFEIHLVLVTQDAPGAEQPPPWVTVHRLNLSRVRQAWLPLLQIIRTERPALVLSNMAHLNFLVLLLKPFLPRQAKILVRQNTTASASKPDFLTRQFYRHLYPKADAILCQSQAMADDFAATFAIPRQKLHILRNPIDAGQEGIRSKQPVRWFEPTYPRILAVGRLSPEKGLDLFIRAMATVRQTYPELQFAILGLGPEEAPLRALARELGLNNSVIFAGHTDPALYHPGATLYVQPSRHEGLPNALLEAAAAGLPIVTTPSSPGLSGLLQDAPGTWITPAISAESLASTIFQALDSLQTQPPRYHHNFLAPFELNTAIAACETLLLKVANAQKLALLIPTIDQIGGAERQVLHLANEFTSRGWQVTIIALSGNEAAQRSQSGIAYLSLGMRKAWIDPRGWLRYLSWHSQNHPEILHAHLPHATWFARCIRLLAPVRVLIDTIHTSHTGTAARKLAYRLSHPLATQVTCVSRSVAQAALAAQMVTPNKLSILPNGVPLPSSENSLDNRENRGAPHLPASFADICGSGTFRWIAIGRLAPVKDYPTLLRAFATLPVHATLQIVGTGPEEPTLRALTKLLKIEDRIDFAGFQPNIQPYLAAADAFVLSSLWEGLPISILEAAAAGLPVVATNASGTREALLPNESGLLAPIGDPAALAQAMRQIMDLPNEARKKMGQRGRQLIEETYSITAVADQWERLYAQLLRQNPSPTRHD